MRRSIATMLGLSLILAAAPAPAATRSFPVPAFAKLRVEGPYTVRVRTGAKPFVKASGPAARLDKLVVENRGGTLLVSTEKSWNWNNGWNKSERLIVDISVPMLEAAELTGSGDVSVDRIRTKDFRALLTGSGDLTIGRLDTGRLTASITGSGDLSVSGQADRAEASVRGSGDLLGTGLRVNLLTASVNGSGDIAIGPTRSARANVVGSGDISIAGRPRCTESKVGSGSIRCGD